MSQPPLDILCLEDSETDFLLIGRELKKLNEPFTLRRATNRAGYETSLAEKLPDIVLCDHNLPDYSSTDAFEAIRHHKSRIPFIIVTATMNEEEAVNRINDGIDDYILKDRLRRLPLAVKRAMMYARSERQRENYFNELIRRERVFRALIENSGEAILLTDENLSVSYASPSFPRIFPGFSENIIGSQVLTLASSAHEKEFRGCCVQVKETPGAFATCTFIARGTTGERWIECAMHNLLDDVNLRAVVFNLRDITPRVRSQESLQRTQAVLTAIIENSQIGFVLVDNTFHVAAYNKMAEERYLTEFNKHLEEGAYIFDYLPADRREITRERFQTAVKGEKFRYEVSFPRKDDQPAWFDVNVFPVWIPGKEQLGFIIATENISGRKLHEREKDQLTADLLSKNKNLEQFSMIISHNLRSPVATIMGLASLLKHAHQLSESEVARCLNGLSQAAQNIDRVIIDLNEILQQQRAVTMGRENINLAHLLADIQTLLASDIRENAVSITTHFDEEWYYGIKSYLHSIFLNLITNSIRYRRTDVRTEITVRSLKQGDHLQLEFSDNGIGIDLNMHGEKMFGLYKKFHLHTDGRGMGLYMVKSQVELMGGTISVESELSKGTRFRITLPA